MLASHILLIPTPLCSQLASCIPQPKKIYIFSRALKSYHHSPIQIKAFVCVFVYRTVCTVPLIDYIDGNKYTLEPQQGGDEDGLARGAWDWSLLWKRIPLSQREKARRKHTTLPYRYTVSRQHANTHPSCVFVSISFSSPHLSVL